MLHVCYSSTQKLHVLESCGKTVMILVDTCCLSDLSGDKLPWCLIDGDFWLGLPHVDFEPLSMPFGPTGLIIAVCRYRLVMISIKWSQTTKKMHWPVQT